MRLVVLFPFEGEDFGKTSSHADASPFKPLPTQSGAKALHTSLATLHDGQESCADLVGPSPLTRLLLHPLEAEPSSVETDFGEVLLARACCPFITTCAKVN